MWRALYLCKNGWVFNTEGFEAVWFCFFELINFKINKIWLPLKKRKVKILSVDYSDKVSVEEIVIQ